MTSQTDSNRESLITLLLTGAWILLGVGLLVAWTVYPEVTWLWIALGVAFFGMLGGVIYRTRRAINSRTAAFGLNSVIFAVLVVSIVGVLNFFAIRYPLKRDVTRAKLHTLSEQTVKVVKGLQKEVKAVYFSKAPQREQVRPLLDNLKGLSTKLAVEYVDPDRETARAKQASIKKYGTLQLVVGQKDNNIEDPTEEKITNALIKLLKEKAQTLCAVTGHGEKSFGDGGSEGYEVVKKALGDQAYEVKDLSLAQETRVPDHCDAIAILGPTKSFFEPEIKALSDYLMNGGKVLAAVDVNIKGAEYAPELLKLLERWQVRAARALIVDPLSRMLGVDAAVPILATFSKENPITKDFQTNCYFPFARPLEIVPSAPSTLTVQWLGQTTPKSWAEGDLLELARGQVSMNPGADKPGPHNVAIAVSGKPRDSKAAKDTRMVVFGTSFFATNNHQRFGGNLDFFMNSVAWLLEDENLIAIRAKEEGPGKVELSDKQANFIFLLSVILVPLAVAIAGVAIWVLRRRL